jgi:PPOX class probable F420-dependent enzyme
MPLRNARRPTPVPGGVAVALPDDVKQFVDDARVFATLATILPDGRPHLTVVWVKRDGDHLLVSTTVDRQQGKNMMRDPRVALVITAPDNPYRYAEIRGNASLTPDPGRELPDELSRKYTGRDYLTFNPASVNDAARLVARITPEKITGQR